MLADLLDEAFDVLKHESPVHARLIRERLGERRILFTVGGERMLSGGGGLSPTPSDGGSGPVPDLVVDTDASTVLEIFDDRLTLLDAVRTGALRARGPRTVIAAAEEAMRVFIHGLVRCPSAPELLIQFRRIVAQKEGRP